MRTFRADDYDRTLYGRDDPTDSKTLPLLQSDGRRRGADGRVRRADRRRLLLQGRERERKDRTGSIRKIKQGVSVDADGYAFLLFSQKMNRAQLLTKLRPTHLYDKGENDE